MHALHRQVGLFPPGGFLRHWGRCGAGEGPLAGCVSESQCVLQDALSMQSPEASLLEVCLLSPEAMCTAQGTPLTPSSCGGHVTPGTLLKGRPGWGWTWPGRHWAPQGGQEAGPGGGGAGHRRLGGWVHRRAVGGLHTCRKCPCQTAEGSRSPGGLHGGREDAGAGRAVGPAGPGVGSAFPPWWWNAWSGDSPAAAPEPAAWMSSRKDLLPWEGELL